MQSAFFFGLPHCFARRNSNSASPGARRWPSNNPVCGPSSVTLSGMNFGVVDATLSATVMGNCAPTDWVSVTSLVCNRRRSLMDERIREVGLGSSYVMGTVRRAPSFLFSFVRIAPWD